MEDCFADGFWGVCFDRSVKRGEVVGEGEGGEDVGRVNSAQNVSWENTAD